MNCGGLDCRPGCYLEIFRGTMPIFFSISIFFFGLFLSEFSLDPIDTSASDSDVFVGKFLDGYHKELFGDAGDLGRRFCQLCDEKLFLVCGHDAAFDGDIWRAFTYCLEVAINDNPAISDSVVAGIDFLVFICCLTLLFKETEFRNPVC